LASETSNTASRTASRRSGALDQHEAAAHGKPLTALRMTGFSSTPVMNGSSEVGSLAAGAPRWSDSFISSPAQSRGPVPVKMATLELLAVAERGPGLGELAAHFMAKGIQPLGSVHCGPRVPVRDVRSRRRPCLFSSYGWDCAKFSADSQDRASPVDKGGPHDDDRRLPVRAMRYRGGGRALDPGGLPLPQLPKDQRRRDMLASFASRRARWRSRAQPEATA